MPSLTESAAIAELADLLYEFLPASGAAVTFATVAAQCGVAEFWSDGPIAKSPKIKTLLEGVLSQRRERFCPLIEKIISEGLLYRRRRGKPMTRAEASKLSAILASLQLEIPELQSSTFLDTLAEDRPALTTEVAAPPLSKGIALQSPAAASSPTTSDDGTSAARPVPAQEGRRATSPASSPTIDIGILTIRDDEFRAVLDVFPSKAGIFKGSRTSREYTLRHADAGNGERYTAAVLCQVEQGNGEAQNAARDLIEDFAPGLILVVGIAGAVPSDDVKLGDVVLSMRIHDFTVEARESDADPTYSTAGGPVAKMLATAIANLPAREDELGDWSEDLPAPPPVFWTRDGQIYGPPEWQSKLRTKLEHHYSEGTTPRAPIYAAGPIASSDRLVKDPALLIPWLQTARKLLAIEMESGGVYRAAQERCPMLAIRGISDIVGLKRDDAWIKYACASAAAFTRAFLRTRPVALSAQLPDPQ